MVKNYVRRGDWFHYVRRVPKRFSQYDDRTHVRIALKTKDEREAQRSAAIYDDFIEKYWGDLVRRGQRDDHHGRYRNAKAMAMAHGFAYKNMAEILESPLEEILSRVEASEGADKAKRQALLGGTDIPQIRLGDCEERFWPLCADRLVKKKDYQVSKYRNPRNAALRNFIGVVGGDLSLAAVERSHILRFRTWLMERVGNAEITGHTANKQMAHVKGMLVAVALDAEIDTDFKMLFAEVKFQEKKGQRASYEAKYLQESFLDQPLLESLNPDARMLIYSMIETGARESELIGLDEREDIILDDGFPHIWIRRNKHRDLKTSNSERKIPLVGVSLEAAKRIVANGGITRYRKNPDSASGAINKFLLENGLRPTTRHTLYSLRHTFKDRLRDAGAPEEVIDELMGHKKRGFQYGRGHTMETKHQWLRKIALRVPPDFTV